MLNTAHKVLQTCPLFAALPPEVLAAWAATARIPRREYDQGAFLAFEDDPCESLGVIESGAVHVCRLFPSGKQITLETFGPGDSYGEALIFSDTPTYPATLIAREKSVVLLIPRAEITRLCEQSPAFLHSLLRMLSNRILLLNRRIKRLAFGSVRQKVANYLLEERKRQGRDQLKLASARHELADALGIPRPSLSRELIAMQEAGWLTFDRRTVNLLDVSALEAALERGTA